MTFQEPLVAEDIKAAQIMERLKCPRGTAFDWLSRKSPPEWQWPFWWRAILGEEVAAKYLIPAVKVRRVKKKT